MLSNKIYKKYGDIWGELFRMPAASLRKRRATDVFGKRQKNNTTFYKFSFYVGRFGFTKRKKTNYGQAFIFKQKLKIFYGFVREAYMRRYWSRSLSASTNSVFTFCHYFESRLEIIVFRANYTFNPFQSRELIEAGFVTVNGRVETRPFYSVRQFDVIQIRTGPSVTQFLTTLVEKEFIPLPACEHLAIDYSTNSIVYLGINKIPNYPMEMDVESLENVYHT